MLLNDLLIGKGLDPKQVLVFRHRPNEPELRKVLPWLAAEKPDVFNAYQQTHGKRVEKALLSARYVASFIGHEPGKAFSSALMRLAPPSPSRAKSSGAFRPTRNSNRSV